MLFVCAADTHGTAIMIAAQARQDAAGIGRGVAAGHQSHLDGFGISFDNWSSTDSHENHARAEHVYRR